MSEIEHWIDTHLEALTINEIIDKFDLKNKARQIIHTYKRHAFCFYAYYKLEMTQTQIGNLISKDHATVIHSIRQHNNLKTDIRYKSITENVLKALKSVNK